MVLSIHGTEPTSVFRLIGSDENSASFAMGWAGPPMLPAREMRTGNLFMNQRVKCAIDTLLSGAFDTIRDARDETDRRLAEIV